MTHRFVVRFFSPEEEKLFAQCLEDMPFSDDVIVQQLGRIGFSGAKVFMFFPSGENSRPHVGKIHTNRGIEREIEGLKIAFNYYEDAGQRTFDVRNDTEGMIAIPLIGAASADGRLPSVTELKDLLFAKSENPDATPGSDAFYFKSHDEVLSIIDGIYKSCCGRALAATSVEGRILGEEYEWYIRKNVTEPMLRCFLGNMHAEAEIHIFGYKFKNPLIKVKELLATRRMLPLSVVHGDLHPSNVVLDIRGNPHLLDFTWCRPSSHVLKDFLVMECSIRFLMLPKYLSWEANYHINNTFMHLEEDDISELKAKLIVLSVDNETIAHIERCAKITQRIRQHAAVACGTNFDICDYIACQALVLYGLMRIERYPFANCALALAQMGQFLVERGFKSNAP
ncbi:phosphotransferase [Methylobacterium nonmethylotrophicum]|uniref:Ternary complex associated domain-containing protein n=1 Tax=Methylobacterium nonmethylotrophicum TaxID=1141884 RepID=A0A4Z0NS90_9HYPH|nr:phosphotransferase [Methylobacterium nonmethylotrophicum]TGD99256.1 hypothetical protein EU555_12020 [Methylobacterium nonmethylotrophicum]